MGKPISHRVEMKRLSPGMKTALSEYKRALITRTIHNEYIAADGDYGRVTESDREELKQDEIALDRHEQTFLRKLLRIQNGEEYTDFEAMKKDLRTMCRVIRNIQMAPAHALEILRTSSSTLKVVADIIDHRRRL